MLLLLMVLNSCAVHTLVWHCSPAPYALCKAPVLLLLLLLLLLLPLLSSAVLCCPVDVLVVACTALMIDVQQVATAVAAHSFVRVAPVQLACALHPFS
jgi:hypothetical protein